MWRDKPERRLLAVLLLASLVSGMTEPMYRHWGEVALMLRIDQSVIEYWSLYRGLESVVIVAGAIAFGLISDRRGRRQGLAAALFLAGIALVAFAASPVTADVGDAWRIGTFAAIVILNFAFGGVIGAGLAWIFEIAPRDRSGSYVARWEVAGRLGTAAALVVSTAIMAVFYWLLDLDPLSPWGWRVPILLAAALLLPLAVVLRRLPEHVQPAESRAVSTWVIILAGIAAFAGISALSRLLDGYLDSYFTSERLAAMVRDYWYQGIRGVGTLVAVIAGTLLGGWFADRRGYRPAVIGGMLASVVMTAAIAILVPYVHANMVIAALAVLTAGVSAFVFPGLVVAIAGQLPVRFRATGLGIALCVPTALVGLIVNRGSFERLTNTELVSCSAIVVVALIAIWVLTSRQAKREPVN
jgi:MFS family permease